MNVRLISNNFPLGDTKTIVELTSKFLGTH